MTKSKKINSIELLRVIAMFAILSMHCQMMLSYWQYDEVPIVGYLFNQLTRFAVPCFFLISGYLIQPKLSENPSETFKVYAKPLLKIWLVWSAICLLLPFNLYIVATEGYLAERMGYWGWLMQNPVNSLLEGGLVHLWFVPALIMAVGIVAAMVSTGKLRWLLPLAGALYLYGVLAGSYQSLTELSSPWFTRNGPFFSTLMVALGFYIRQKCIQFSSSVALGIALLGLIMHMSEAAWLTQFNIAFNIHDFLFGTAIWATGLFLWFLSNPKLGDKPWIHTLGSQVLAIYVSHMLFIIIMNNVVGILGLEHQIKDLALWLGTVALTLIFVFAIRGTRFESILLR